jgi:uncharacterized membrane protein
MFVLPLRSPARVANLSIAVNRFQKLPSPEDVMKQGALIAMAFALVQIAGAQEYRITDLGPLTPVAINAEGHVAGNYNNRAYVWTEGSGMHDLGLLPGGTFSLAAGINDRGAVTGTADGPGTVTWTHLSTTETATCPSLIQPFVWRPWHGLATPSSIPLADLELTTIGAPASFCSSAYYTTGINFSDEVVFTSLEASSYIDGFLWNGSGAVTYIGGDLQDGVNAISNHGAIVGQSLLLPARSSSALWESGVETTLPALIAGSLCSGATSVNDRGEVVGLSETTAAPCLDDSMSPPVPAAPVHAYLWDTLAGITDLGALPGDASSVAVRISPTGEVVGNSGDITAYAATVPPYVMQVAGHPFLWTKHRGMRDLNDLIDPHSGWTLDSAADINVWGQIVGTGTYKGKTRGFLLTPRFF